MVQLSLIPPEPLVPLPTDSGHYVAALQNQPGERDALRHASDDAWARMTPLMQFVGPKKRRAEPFKATTVSAWVKRVSDALGDHPFYLDILRLKPTDTVLTTTGKVPLLEHIYSVARRRQLRFIPVVWAGESTVRHCELTRDAALADGRGLAFRIRILRVMPPVGTTWSSYLRSQLEEVCCPVERADLLVDLGYLDADSEVIAEDLAASLREMLAVGAWRGVAVLGTSMPSSLSCVTEGTVGSLPRREWQLWVQLKQCPLQRVPAFGDYAIQHPSPPSGPGGPGMRANIRYTSSDATVIARGEGPVTQEGNSQYQLLCQQLVAQAGFEGGAYSWGDKVIEECARGAVAPGAQRMWRGAGTSHHLELVTNQLQPETAS